MINWKQKRIDSNSSIKALKSILFSFAFVVALITPTTTNAANYPSGFDYNSIPAYNVSPIVAVNNNKPFFTDSDMLEAGTTSLSNLDSLGRCGAAEIAVSPSTLPTTERGEIGSVKPSGWHTVKYDGIDGNYLYNRCHLLAFELSGLNAEPKNLITGTRYMNINGMLSYENTVTNYVKSTSNPVLYRATPVFVGNELVARGVLLEAKDIPTNGGALEFCVFCYNVQPGITIDYSTGDSSGPEFTGSDNSATNSTNSNAVNNATAVTQPASSSASYIGNANTHKFHYSSCKSVSQMSDKNKVYLNSRDEAINAGYQPCKNCNP